MEREVNKYRIPSARLINWDYSSYGFYFITICTKDKKCFLGRIKEGAIASTEAGKIVCSEWTKTGKLRKSIYLDEWKLMPNHFHAIIILDTEKPMKDEKVKKTNWEKNSLGSIINQFKGSCTKKIREKCNSNFSWQGRYYDHIIRNERELYLIRNYIKYNDIKWKEDRYYSEK